jgi:1,4-dihydroxy-2-naphthoate octaprenyltransferase
MGLVSQIFRLSRAQFLPVILSPVLVGSVLAWWTDHSFSPFLFVLVVLGGIFLHLGANTIDDAFDFESGVDVISNDMFPPDFGGWKILPRGLMTFTQARMVAYLFFVAAAIVGLSLTMLVGPIILLLGGIGLFFAYFHVAPPLRLGYRGLGLSELGIFLSFGVLPVAGSFYVQAGYLSSLSLLLGISLGFLTASVLINHDQIFFDAYQKGSKMSLTLTLGRRNAMATAFILTAASFAIILFGAALRVLPISTLLVFVAIPLLIAQTRLYRTPARSPMHYVKLTQTTFALSTVFGVLVALGLILG